jgi:hypothetical protein
MIRRNDGDHWLIVDQINHAQLAADIARAWGNESTSALPATPDVVWAVEHHDDGWSERDRNPLLDPETGIPRQFGELRMRDSTATWTRSIEFCSSRPLAGIAVSRHFDWLAARYLADPSRRLAEETEDRQAAERFVNNQRVVRNELFRELRAAKVYPNQDLEQLGEGSFRAVQFFDRLSLWLCCAERTEDFQLEAPGGEQLTFRPRTPSQVIAEPYLLGVESLRLETTARRIAARPYASQAEFQSALSAAAGVHLSWSMCAD